MLVKVIGLYTLLNLRNYDHWNKKILVIVNKCILFHSYSVYTYIKSKSKYVEQFIKPTHENTLQLLNTNKSTTNKSTDKA